MIEINRSSSSGHSHIDWNNLGFGKYFSDHIYVSDFENGSWDSGRIEPYGPMPIEPAMCTLHYGQTIFEGLKAYKTVDGGVNLFRPDMNAKRLHNSAVRLCIPPFDEKQFIEALQTLVSVDISFVPDKPGQSLYLRPFIYGSGNFLGVHSPDTFRHIIMSSPVGSYYKEGLNPVRIKISDEHVRAVRGGLGMAKTAANYAASLYGTEQAKKEGFAQVLWLDGVSLEFIDEVGAMNIMFIIGDELITPPLSQGSILPGVTRDTILKLAPEIGLKPVERRLSISEIEQAYADGTLNEVFGSGTAAVVSPVGSLHYKGKEMKINSGVIGQKTQELYDMITGIYTGRVVDKWGWTVPVEVPEVV
ncbi:MAG: branched-chain amino acid aminotransferase [Candidatus Kapaibacteriales bacterium]